MLDSGLVVVKLFFLFFLNCNQGGTSQLPDGRLLFLLDGRTLPGRPERKERCQSKNFKQ